MEEEVSYRECLDLAVQVSREEFERRLAGYYLIGELSEDSGVPDIVTGVVSMDVLKARHDAQVARRRERMREGGFLLRIRKRKANKWISWISVGRAANNDLVLRHHTISKLHARLDTRAPFFAREKAKDGRLWISDTGSSGGTAVNGKLLEKSERRPLRFDDRIRLGDVDLVFVDAAGLYDRLVGRP